MSRLLGLVLLALLTKAVRGQELLRGAEAAQVEKVLTSLAGERNGHGQLDCRVNPLHPFLDFSFRFEAGFVVACPVRIFEGRRTLLRAYIKLTPESGPPVILGSAYMVPAIPSNLRDSVRIEKVKSDLEASGGFFLGEGRYSVEMLVTDDRRRFKIHHWKAQAQRGFAEHDVKCAMAPYSVAAVSEDWKAGERARTGSLRVTIFVHAAPMNPYAQKLRAWDRAFLLGSVAAVMKNLPIESTRLVAFNLDQQRELYRENDFNTNHLPDLGKAMESLELGVVPVRTLAQEDGGINLLKSLVESTAKDREIPDAVIFLGPWTKLDASVPKHVLQLPGQASRFYDIVYFAPALRGREFTDVVQRLTGSLDGSVQRIHSPGELARVLDKISAQLMAGQTAR